MTILEKSPVELSTMTKAQILAAIAADQDALRAEQRDIRVVSQSQDSRGMLEQTIETVDGNGKLIGRTEKTWSYYERATDGVKDINIKEYDGAGKLVRYQTVQHGEGQPRLVEREVADAKI